MAVDDVVLAALAGPAATAAEGVTPKADRAPLMLMTNPIPARGALYAPRCASGLPDDLEFAVSYTDGAAKSGSERHAFTPRRSRRHKHADIYFADADGEAC